MANIVSAPNLLTIQRAARVHAQSIVTRWLAYDIQHHNVKTGVLCLPARPELHRWGSWDVYIKFPASPGSRSQRSGSLLLRGYSGNQTIRHGWEVLPTNRQVLRNQRVVRLSGHHPDRRVTLTNRPRIDGGMEQGEVVRSAVHPPFVFVADYTTRKIALHRTVAAVCAVVSLDGAKFVGPGVSGVGI